MNKIVIDNLDWDTDYFGIKCGKISIRTNEFDVKSLVSKCNEFDFVSIQNIGNSTEINRKIACFKGAFLADINIQFEKKISIKQEDEKSIVIIAAEDVKTEKINKIDIEENDFKYSKFVCDPFFKKKKGYLVYKEWLRNACGKKNKYFVFFKDDKGCIVAYILFSAMEKTGTIELVKVDKEYQGKNIAKKMISAIEMYLYQQDFSVLKVGTQLNNIPAINLYHSVGFKEISRTSVYHFWKKVN